MLTVKYGKKKQVPADIRRKTKQYQEEVKNVRRRFHGTSCSDSCNFFADLMVRFRFCFIFSCSSAWAGPGEELLIWVDQCFLHKHKADPDKGCKYCAPQYAGDEVAVTRVLSQ